MDLSASLTHSVFNTVGRVADRRSLETYVVGGFVRDILLNKSSKDID
ncbi:MAG TPA: hypothetical protein VF490_08805, partial [Chryseosolibacter sp.]